MRILRSYILRETIVPFFLAIGVLTCVFLLGNLVKLANLVINKGISLTVVGKIFLLYIPLLLGYTLPIACLIAVILAFGRLSADNEILAIRASGIHIIRILVPLFFLGMIISLGALALNSKVIPYAHHEQRRMLKQLGSENPTAMLEAGVFIHSFQNQVLFIHKIEGNTLHNITIYQPQPEGRMARTIISKSGEFTNIPGTKKIKLKLIDGTSDEIDPQNPDTYYKLNFENYFMTLDLSKDDKKLEKKPKSMTLKELSVEIERLEKLFIDNPRLRTEYHRKISWSFASLFLILLGFPIAVITHKREKTTNVVLAVFCALFYYLLSLACEAVSIKTDAPPGIAMWGANIAAAFVALIFNIKLCRK